MKSSLCFALCSHAEGFSSSLHTDTVWGGSPGWGAGTEHTELFEELRFLWHFISFHLLKSLEVVNNIPLYSEESETQKG